MRVIKPSTLSLVKQTYDLQGHQFVVSAFSFFQLGSKPSLLEESAQWLRLQPYLADGVILDTGHAKGCGECLLAGKGYVQGAKPTEQMQVHLNIGEIDKSVLIIGDRTCTKIGLLGQNKVSHPQPFTCMALGDAQSYGGKGYSENPAGQGKLDKDNFDGELYGYRLPNLYLANESIEVDKKPRTVASFAPRALTHPQRAQYQGTYDQYWLDHIHPGFPQDTDLKLFHVAPLEQQQSRFFSPNEPYLLSGFHPQRQVIEGRLPNVLVRAFVTQEEEGTSQFKEIPTYIDTVWFFPDLELGIAIHRGSLPVTDSAGLDIKNLLLALENITDTPRDKAYFQQVLAERTNPKTSAGHAFHASQLLPQQNEEEIARRAKLYAQAQAEYEQKVAEKRQKQLTQLQQEHPELDWSKISAATPVSTSAPGPIPQEFIDKKDFDLTPYIEFSRQQAQAAKNKMAKMREQARATHQPTAKSESPISQSDLLERFSQAILIQASDKTKDDMLPNDASAQQKQEHIHHLMLKSQRRSRQLSPSIAQRGTVSESGAALLRQQVMTCLRAGESLAGRDLSGADLSHLDLKGLDLRDVMLERANLTHANLSGCQCDGIVLTEAIVDGACLDNARFIRANLSRVRCENLSCNGAVFDHTTIIESTIKGSFIGAQFIKMNIVSSDLTNSGFIRAVFIGVKFIQSCLKHTVWKNAQLSLCTFLECEHQGSGWYQASLKRCAFLKAYMSDMDFSQIKAQKTQFDVQDGCDNIDFADSYWEYSGFRNLSLSHCCFEKSVFLHCDFSFATLLHSLFSQSLWHSSLMFQATVQNCSGEGVLFYQSNLRKTIFEQSDFPKATFHQTNLREVDFKNSHLKNMQRYPLPSLTK